jgi:signal transduction histidine kinase
MVISRTAEKIIYYDEVLTMSSRLAANPSQNTKYWHERYLKHELLLDEAINRILSSADKLDYNVSPIIQTDEANKKLISMEYKAFTLSNEGNFKKARQVLFSPEYKVNKEIYFNSVVTVVENIRKRMEDLLENARKDILYVKITTLIGTIILIMLWIYTIINIKKWHNKTLEAFNETTIYSKKLEQSSADIKAKNHELERFNFIVAHDLKESLRSIFSFSQLASNEEASKDAKEYLSKIQNSCKSMSILIDDLLSYAKLENKQINLVNIDLSKIIDILIEESLHDLIKSKNVKISYEELPTINTDKTKLTQALRNLITNAIIYNNSDHPCVDIYSKNTKENTIIYIKDNGIGIENEYSESIFELFNRLHDKRKYRGTGLGLSICKKAIESLGGKIWLEKSNKKGSVFAISLPKTYQ